MMLMLAYVRASKSVDNTLSILMRILYTKINKSKKLIYYIIYSKNILVWTQMLFSFDNLIIIIFFNRKSYEFKRKNL